MKKLMGRRLKLLFTLPRKAKPPNKRVPRVPNAATALRESPALALLRALAFFCRRAPLRAYLHCYATQEKNTLRRPKSPCGAASALYECATHPSTPRAAVTRRARAPENVRVAQVKP